MYIQVVRRHGMVLQSFKSKLNYKDANHCFAHYMCDNCYNNFVYEVLELLK